MGRSESRVFLILVFTLIVMPFISAEVATELNVPNSPPEFDGLIPNFSWIGGDYLDAFNMNDYFEDIQGDPMIFSVVGNDSIMVNIDSEGFVSFFPPADYIGTQVLTFYADDGYGNIPSNLVYLGIGVDLEPPKWYYPKKGKSKVYQNDFIDFTANWTDNFELASYYLSIDQGDGWVNDVPTVFTGTKNNSLSSIQISAPIGKFIDWKICAKDASDNEACTDIYNFAVVKKPIAPDGNAGSGEGGTGGDGTSTGGRITGENIKDLYKEAKDLVGTQSREDYSVDIDSFLVELKQGTSLTRFFEIINTGTEELVFDLSISGLEKYSTLSTSNFTLGPGETKTSTIDFDVGLTATPGQYFGTLVVQSVQDVVIPIVLTINAANLEFEVRTSVLQDYKNIKPGEAVFTNINITNNGDAISSDITITYAIKDFYGNIYNTQEEVLTLETAISMERNLTIPEEILLGRYIFYVRAVNEKDVAIGSDDFMVGLSFRFEAFLKSSSIFLIVAILSILSVILSLRYRDQKKKERALNLYVKLTELKKMIRENKFDKAANLYISIKRIYGEPISRIILDDKQKLIDEIKKLAGKVNFEEPIKVEESKEEEAKNEIDPSKEGGKADKEEEVKNEPESVKEESAVDNEEEEKTKEGVEEEVRNEPETDKEESVVNNKEEALSKEEDKKEGEEKDEKA